MIEILGRVLLGIALFFAPAAVSTAEANHGVSFPFKNHSDAAPFATAGGPGVCGTHDLLAVRIVKDGTKFWYFYAVDREAYIYSEFAQEGDNLPVRLWFGKGNQDEIKGIKHETFDPVKHGAGPCSVFYPDGA